MEKINVLVVDDSAFMRKLISQFLDDCPQIHVIGTARNGEDAVKKAKTLKPDVVTLDIEMPVMNGLDALEIIMKECPVPVIMLSSTTQRGAENTLAAMQAGAVDFIAKPSGSISIDLHRIKEELIQKVISASQANILPLGGNSEVSGKSFIPSDLKYSKIELNKDVEQRGPKSPKRSGPAQKIICIGTSTGGPRALQQVLTGLPKNIGAPILIVQHMPPGFTKSLAERLNALCRITVKEAEDGEVLRKGTAYIAPGGYHLKANLIGTNLVAVLDQSSPRNGHRPSVDVMFESLAMLSNYPKIAVIMTGMGSDGSRGLVDMKQSGNVVAIAESQGTSIVYGMPRAAIATSLVDEVRDLGTITEAILEHI